MRPWIALCLCACAAPAPEPTPSSATAWIDGRAYPISRAFVFATDNGNTEWRLVLASKRAFPADFSGDLRSVRADFGGGSHAMNSIGGSPEVVYFQLAANRDQASDFARKLGVECSPRVDPKLDLRSSLVLLPEAKAGDPPRTAHFVLENRGPGAFAFLDAGPGHGAEPKHRFQVAVERDGVLLPAVEPRSGFGGLARQVTLEPGASHRFEIDLGEWTNFDAPGLYRLRVSCLQEIEVPPGDRSEPYADAHLRWDQSSSAECLVRVP